MIWEELGVSFGTAIIVLIALYFIIKWGVKNGIKQYFEEKEEEAKLKRQLEAYHSGKGSSGDEEDSDGEADLDEGENSLRR